MNSRQTNHLRAALLIVVLVPTSALSGLVSQTPAKPIANPAPAVPLNAGACAPVPASGTVSLDWNPGFDYESAVAGIDRFSLIFTSTAADGVTPLRPGGPGAYAVRSMSVTPLTNGYYHIEFQVPRMLQPGMYRVVDAAVAPHLVSGYQGSAPQMTNSPARIRFCITIVPSFQPKSPAPPQPGG